MREFPGILENFLRFYQKIREHSRSSENSRKFSDISLFRISKIFLEIWSTSQKFGQLLELRKTSQKIRKLINISEYFQYARRTFQEFGLLLRNSKNFPKNRRIFQKWEKLPRSSKKFPIVQRVSQMFEELFIGFVPLSNVLEGFEKIGQLFRKFLDFYASKSPPKILYSMLFYTYIVNI